MRELHEDGEPHLHIVVSFEKPLDVRKPDFFDCIGEKHGNYQVARNEKDVLNYVKKYDQEPLIMGELPDGRTKMNKVTVEIDKLVKEGATTEQLVETYGSFLLLHFKQVQSYMSVVRKINQDKQLKPWVKFDMESVSDLATLCIMDWCNENIKRSRFLKQRQLFIHGRTNLNKTRFFVEHLKPHLRVYYPAHENFFNDYEDGAYDLILFDEFERKRYSEITFFNQIFDGSSCRLRTKGGTVQKNDNLPVIVISNFSFSENFGQMYNKESLQSRLLEVEVVNPIPVNEIKRELV